MIYPLRVAPFFIHIYKSYIWRIPNNKKEVYLTFDDGPDPEITPWVMDLLDTFNAKATFFCVGENAKKYPQLIEELVKRGHSIGNHSHTHISGYTTSVKKYIDNVKIAKPYLNTNLFRPPFGRIRLQQAKSLPEFKIIMWTIICGDFHPKLKVKKVLKKMVSKTKVGDIIVFHDSKKAEKNLKSILPSYIKQLSDKEFIFRHL